MEILGYIIFGAYMLLTAYAVVMSIFEVIRNNRLAKTRWS